MPSDRVRPARGSLLAPVRNERGVALITALIALLLLTALLISFAVLSTSEPTIARNQAWTAQARVVAESGVERAVWALTSPGGIPNPMAGTIAPPPYDGSTYLALGTVGGFFVTVRAGPASNERVIDVVGWVPTYTTTGLRTAHKHIHLTVNNVKWINPQGALSVGGTLQTSGSAVTIDSSRDSSCGRFSGTFTSEELTRDGTLPPRIYGHDPSPPSTVVPATTFDQFTFTNADLDMLKALAKLSNQYFKGNTTFDGSHPWPANGIVFVDTASGNDLDCTARPNSSCTNPPTDMITLTITGSGPMPTLNGWLIVNGSISWSGDATVNGLVYAQNDVDIAGNATVHGAIVSRNIVDTASSTSGDSRVGGNLTVTYNCYDAKTGNGTIPAGWYLKLGSYREMPD